MITVAHALAAYHRSVESDRGDEHALHVADLSKCPREVWARRNSKPMLPYTTETRRKFRVGIDLEKEVVDAIEHAYGKDYIIHRGVLCWLDLAADGNLIGDYEEPVPGDDEYNDSLLEVILQAHPNAVIGHPDALLIPKHDGLPRIVVEVKSTLFFERTQADGRKERAPDEQPQYQYKVQTSAYGLACKADVALITVSCIQSGKTSPESPHYRYHPERDRALIQGLVGRYQQATAIGAPEPPAQPPDYARRMRPGPLKAANWLCDYCRYGACSLNNNPQRLEVSL